MSALKPIHILLLLTACALLNGISQGAEGTTNGTSGISVNAAARNEVVDFSTVSTNAVPEWGLGPFTRPADPQPVIRPNPDSLFNCPIRKSPVRWEFSDTFNPAAVVKDGKVYVIYRAEDNFGKGLGNHTSRLGLAVSEDGIHFQKMPEPVLFPAEDAQKEREWEGGCEDPRIIETEDGTYYLFYTQWQRSEAPKKREVFCGVATSKDLIHWTKQEFRGSMKKSNSPVCKVVDGRLIAARINGRYWLYHGEGQIKLSSSEDLLNWKLEEGSLLDPLDENGRRLRGDSKDTDNKVLLARREGKFDAGFPEVGPPALLTEKGIVLLYNGKNGPALTDIGLGAGAYSGGQALFSATDPGKLLDRTAVPFIKPELPWEKSGQYPSGTTFIEGLVLFKNQWFLYYGCADSFVGVATAPVKPGQLNPIKSP